MHVAAILRNYLAANPWAADTIEGVTRWWFPAAVGSETMLAAVELLVREGALQRHRTPDGKVIYAGLGAVGTPQSNQ